MLTESVVLAPDDDYALPDPTVGAGKNSGSRSWGHVTSREYEHPRLRVHGLIIITSVVVIDVQDKARACLGIHLLRQGTRWHAGLQKG